MFNARWTAVIATVQVSGEYLDRSWALRLVQGAVLVAEEGSFHFPGYEVNAVDTQGAGDAFLGSLAARLAQGAAFQEAVSFANWAAAQSVTRRGSTQQSLPDPSSAVNADVSRCARL